MAAPVDTTATPSYLNPAASVLRSSGAWESTHGGSVDSRTSHRLIFGENALWFVTEQEGNSSTYVQTTERYLGCSGHIGLEAEVASRRSETS
jgi:hypothetical protein